MKAICLKFSLKSIENTLKSLDFFIHSVVVYDFIGIKTYIATGGFMKLAELQYMFNEFKALTLEQVSRKYGCSIRTVQRQFARLSVLRSYNKNSRYHTLSHIPDFNSNGIWRYRDILFSKHGDLKKTVKRLILKSERGLSGNEIGEAVNLSPRSFMHHFREMEGIFREKHEGVYVYFSNAPEIYAKQSSKRVRTADARRIDDSIAVKILVEYIKSPELSAMELSVVLNERRNCRVSTSEVETLLEFHGLLKKTPDSRR